MQEQPEISEEKELLLGTPTPLDTDGKDKVFATIEPGIESQILAWMNGRSEGESTADDVEHLVRACPTPFEFRPLEFALIEGVKKQDNQEALELCQQTLDSLKRKLYGGRLELYEKLEQIEGGNGWNTKEEEQKPEEPEEEIAHKPLLDYIKSPLDNPMTMDEIIDIYAKPVGQFYNNLQYAHQDEKIASPENEADKEAFRTRMFKRWKKSYLDVKDETATEEQKYIKSFLQNYPDVKSVYELKEIAEKSYPKDVYEQIEKVLDDNNWEHEENGWTHILSERSKAGAAAADKTKHRLYLNLDNSDIYKTADLLVGYFDAMDMPFYFKFDNDGGKRDDTIVLYCADDDLEKTIAILKKIQKTNPEIAERAGKPAMLVGRYDDWIGYGAHPEKHAGEKKSSYSEIRARLLEEALGATADTWLNDHDEVYQREVKELAAKKVLAGREEIYKIWQSKGRTDDEIRAAIGYGEAELAVQDLDKLPVSNDDLRKATCEHAKHDEAFIEALKKNIHDLSPKYHVHPDYFCANR